MLMDDMIVDVKMVADRIKWEYDYENYTVKDYQCDYAYDFTYEFLHQIFWESIDFKKLMEDIWNTCDEICFSYDSKIDWEYIDWKFYEAVTATSYEPMDLSSMDDFSSYCEEWMEEVWYEWRKSSYSLQTILDWWVYYAYEQEAFRIVETISSVMNDIYNELNEKEDYDDEDEEEDNSPRPIEWEMLLWQKEKEKEYTFNIKIK